MILYPNVFCAKNKECKGKVYNFPAKKSFHTKTRPEIPLTGHLPVLPHQLP
jgi:hypothetical protein